MTAPGNAVSEIADTEARQEPRIPSLLTGIKPNAAATLAIALAATVIAFFVVWIFVRPIALLLFGIIIAQALSPLVDRLQRWLSQSLAIAVVYLSLIGLFSLMGWIIVPALVEQGQDLVERAPDLYERAQTWLNENELLDGRISTEEIQAQVTGQIGRLGSVLVNLPLIIISIYWIVAGPTLRPFVLSLFPYERQGHAGSVLTKMGQTMGGYVRGVFLNATIIATLAFIGLSLIGVQYALVLALIAGVLDFVPIVGPIVATIPIVGIALLDSPTTALTLMRLGGEACPLPVHDDTRHRVVFRRVAQRTVRHAGHLEGDAADRAVAQPRQADPARSGAVRPARRSGAGVPAT